MWERGRVSRVPSTLKVKIEKNKRSKLWASRGYPGPLNMALLWVYIFGRYFQKTIRRTHPSKYSRMILYVFTIYSSIPLSLDIQQFDFYEFLPRSTSNPVDRYIVVYIAVTCAVKTHRLSLFIFLITVSVRLLFTLFPWFRYKYFENWATSNMLNLRVLPTTTTNSLWVD
jgi:hypothetical protein